MVHLSVAVNMYGADQNSYFFLGSIAPDAIHIRPNTRYHDKISVHLADLPEQRFERARQLFAQYRTDESDANETAFADGYVTHLLTDFLWRERVIGQFRKQVPSSLPYDKKWKLYYQETDQNDFNLYCQMPWRKSVWAKLSETIPGNFGIFLTSDEIAKWRDRVLRWFDDKEKEPKIEPVYISYKKTQNFINQVSPEIKRILEEWNS